MKTSPLYLTLFFVSLLASAFASTQYLILDNLDFMAESDQKILHVIRELNEYSDDVVAFSLTNNAMTSDNFQKITKGINNLKTLSKLKVLDLSNNKLDENSASTLATWLCLDSQPYIKLTGTPIALKNVVKLYNRFKAMKDSSSEKASSFMKKIIFMSQDYINKANKSVQIYKTLVSQGVIPENWAGIHQEFYQSEEYKSLLKEREFNQYQSTMLNMQRLSISPRPNIPDREQGLEDEGDEQDNLIDFNTALESISPNLTPTATAIKK